jgi:anaerobic selenocysteine-containing dehydrogenase
MVPCPAVAETVASFCRICEALCGLELDVDRAAGRVLYIRPDPEHVASRGFACIKGLRQHELYQSPDRLRQPLERQHGRLRPVTWEHALARIGEHVRSIRAQHHPDAIAMYVGTAAGFSILHPPFAQGFMQGLGSGSTYSSATQDCSNKFAVATLMYGFPFLQPFPDLGRTQCLVMVGANPAVSKWSFLQVSNPVQRLKAIEARGGSVFVVDPRRTESAKAAGEHVYIRPGTDVFFYLAFLHELFATHGIDEARADQHARGLADLRELCAPWTPERQAEVTKIPADTLRRIVRAYATADGAALYCSTGVNMGGQGSLAFWLQEAINFLSGNLDRPGGTLVGKGIFDFPGFAKRRGLLVSQERSRVGGLPVVNDARAGGVLADEILTPGDRQVRALFVTGGNPLLTMPNAGRLREALRKLELLVVLDILPGETASEAHYVLPCTSPLERPDLPFLFPLWLGMQSQPYLQGTRAVVPPPGQARDEASIYLELCRACGVDLFGSKVAQTLLEGMSRANGWLEARRERKSDRSENRNNPAGDRNNREDGPRGASRGHDRLRVPQELLLSLMLRASGEGGFGRLLRHRHGRTRVGTTGHDFLGQRVLTSDGKLDLAPAPLLSLARTLEPTFERERTEASGLRLITRRAVGTHNSWTHNHPKLVGKRPTNVVYVHPDDAARLGLQDGALADVQSDVATIRLPVELCRDLMPGTVAVPHGWGHQRATGLSVAGRTQGVNVNLLAADGPERLDPVSGMARLTGLPVQVRPAAGPKDETDWSGVPLDE